jgi:hypothetical protein
MRFIPRTRFILKIAFILSSVFFVGTSSARAELSFSSNSQVHLQADRIEYLKDQNLVTAKGQVHVQQGAVHLYADSVRYDLTAQSVEAKGHVVWQDENQEIEARILNYNLRTKEGKAFDVKTSAPPWISTGSEVEIKENKTIVKNAVMTTCDFPPGYRHYFLNADKITIYSGDYLVAENVVLYIGKVPVLYFPFFVRTIHDLRTPFSVSTGSTEYLGNYILFSTNYFFSPGDYGALYTDYFSKKGFGLGIRHEIKLNDFSVLSLYGYGVPEGDTNRFRWESRVRGSWAVSSNLTGRVEVALPGDGFFSQDYSVAKREPGLVSTAREYNISATYSGSQYTASALFRRQEIVDASDLTGSHFVGNLQNLPQVTLSFFPRALFGRNILNWDLNLRADHTYTKANDYYVNHVSGGLGLSQNLSFLQTQSLFLGASFTEFYQDLSDVGFSNGGESHTLGTNSTWTGHWSDIFTTSLSHIYSKKYGQLSPTDPTGGVQNQLSGWVEFTAGSFFRAKTTTSFDFQANVTGDSSRFSFLRQEFYLTPASTFDCAVIGDYSIKANALKDVSAFLHVKSPRDLWNFRISGNFVDPKVGNTGFVTVGTEETFNVTAEVSFVLFTNYRVSALESYDLIKSSFVNRSISLYRDLHDWEAELNYTEDPFQGKKVFFKLNLKAFPGRPLSVSDDQLERLNGLRNQGLTGAAGQFQ